MKYRNIQKKYKQICKSLIILLSNISSSERKVLLIFFDLLMLLSAMKLSIWFNTAQNQSEIFSYYWLIIFSPLVGVPLYILTGQYKGIIRYTGSRSIYFLAIRNFALIILLMFIGYLANLPMLNIKTWILAFLLTTGIIGTFKFLLRDALLNLNLLASSVKSKVAIYGAGQAGAQLLSSLRIEDTHNVITFIDDAKHLWSRNINGIPINPRKFLKNKSSELDQVLLAIPSLKRKKKIEILRFLKENNLNVFEVPSIKDIETGRAKIDNLRKIVIEDLIDRESNINEKNIVAKNIHNSVVFVTGAGGSIGSELCRQILDLKPSKLIMLDNSEPSLYKIDKEIKEQQHECTLVSVLGNATDYNLIFNLFNTHNVDSVFHTAAYKHVPLVQANPLQGIANNVISTRVICKAASCTNVEQVMLISSDKAVRPTNVMGASKRLSELIIQDYATINNSKEQEKLNENSHSNKKTCYSLVRFGNVLNSSGSVVPLFKRQIKNGGPITITHPEIIRYFMTINEAVRLVLHTNYLAKGGEIFLLDMGNPIKIKDLALNMINLSGLELKDDQNPDGDIEIIYTGLREGEKLFEELLINSESKETSHPLIFRAIEPSIDHKILENKLAKLEEEISFQNVGEVLDILSFLVPEWDRKGYPLNHYVN